MIVFKKMNRLYIIYNMWATYDCLPLKLRFKLTLGVFVGLNSCMMDCMMTLAKRTPLSYSIRPCPTSRCNSLQPRTRGSRCSHAAKRRWAPSQRCRKNVHPGVGTMGCLFMASYDTLLVGHRCWKQRLPRTLLFVSVLLLCCFLKMPILYFQRFQVLRFFCLS